VTVRGFGGAGGVPAEVAAFIVGDTAAVDGVFASFLQQDSGCRAFGVRAGSGRWFAKVPVEARAGASVRRAVTLHASVRHATVVPLLGTVPTEHGPALVYPWVDGEVLYGAPTRGRATRVDPSGPHARFRALPLPAVLAAVDSVFDAHIAVAAAGFVAVDLYDGCFIYDFARRRMWLCDLDEYRPGPFCVDGDRLPGSTRFMAPEELRSEGAIDQRTTVFNLGRTARVLLDSGDLDGRFRGSGPALGVLGRALRIDPGDRYQTVPEFLAAWRTSVG